MNIKKRLFFCTFILANSLFGQIYGPANVCPGSFNTYTYYVDVLSSSYSWTVVGGFKMNCSGSGTNCVRVIWSGGQMSISVATDQGIFTKNVTEPSALASASDDAVCFGSSVTLSLSSGGNSFTEWQHSTDGGANWSLLTTNSSATSSIYTSSKFRAKLNSPSCGVFYSNDLNVEVLSISAVGGSLTGDNEFFGIASDTLNLSGYTGDIVKWQYKEESGSWTDIASTSNQLIIENVQSTREYRAMVSDGCYTVESSIATIQVLPVPTLDIGAFQMLRPGLETTLATSPGHADYRWFKDGVEIQDEDLHQLSVKSPGAYSVEVTSDGGAVYETGSVVIGSQFDINENSIITYSYNVALPNIEDPFDTELISRDNVYDAQRIAVDLYDGLGRLKKNIWLGHSSNTSDIVTPVAYDEYGRKNKSYLPYVDDDISSIEKVNALVENDYTASLHYAYYMQSNFASSKAFSETCYESSPLNRPLNQGAPGDAWQIGSATIDYSYDAAVAGEVLKWTYETMMSDGKDDYGDGQLYKNITTDEDANQTIEYTNQQGQVLLKMSQVNSTTWAETYYIYDIYGQLAVVLPPEATSRLDSEFFGQSTQSRKDFLNTWAFLYDYDGRNRMIMKKVPGAEPVWMVYDRWDRLVLTQDGEQRAEDLWLFTSYDALNRPVIAGMLKDTDASHQSQESMQDWVMGLTSHHLEFSSGDANFGYGNNAFPFSQTSGALTIEKVLTVTYFDDYSFVNDTDLAGTSFDLIDDFDPAVNPANVDPFHLLPAHNSDVKGQVTGTLTREEGNDFITTITYYDDKYRPIQVVSENHLGGTDVISNQYDFIGNLRRTQTKHTFDGKTTVLKRRYTYDHANRLLDTFHEVDDQGEVLLSSNQYNELGELKEKHLHEGAQSIDYSYNIRGWLTSMQSDMFSQDLHYNINPLDPSKVYYNGNIAGIEWTNHDNNGEGILKRGYTYDYDGLNRLEDADHHAFITGWTNTDAYDMNVGLYDLNGNIKALQRRGTSASEFIDDLTYGYQGNQLKWVKDNLGDSTGFNNGYTADSDLDPDYTYDANGNMRKDLNKGIHFIYYNHLNLPTKVVMSSTGEDDRIEYLYDAAGNKLRQTVFEGGIPMKTTDYVGEFIYEDGNIQLIQHEEGRLIPWFLEEGSTIGGYDYQYHLKDHLGNVRVTFDAREYEMMETFETGEDHGFFNLHRYTYATANSTPGGNEVERLSAGQTGAMVMLNISPGDTINIKVNANYEETPTGNTFAEIAHTAIFSVFDASPYGTGEGSAVIQNEFYEAVGSTGMAGKNDTHTAPRAFLNYIVFDTAMNYQYAGFEQISTDAHGIGLQEQISIEKIIASDFGHILIYLSNENQEAINVYFDDLYVEHKLPVSVVSSQDYYPFGLAFNKYERTASTKNFMNTFQDQEYEEETGWVKFKWRNHQPDIGRFFNIDPLAEDYYYNSPYAFSENKVVAHIELEGLESVPFAIRGIGNNIEQGIKNKITTNGTPEQKAKQQRDFDAGMKIAGGIVSTAAGIASGGIFGMVSIITGTFGTAAGGAELGLNNMDNPTIKAEDVPDNPGEGFGLAYDELVGNENNEGQTAGGTLNNLVNFIGPLASTKGQSAIELLDLAITGNSLIQNGQDLANSNDQSSTNQTNSSSQNTTDDDELPDEQ